MTARVSYASTLKPAAVETPLDLLFFRPMGFALVKVLLPTTITANQVTAASIVTGLVGAALSASSRRDLRVAGALLGIAYGVLDCADGQLARARGTSSRVGRILDGASDYISGLATGTAVASSLGRKYGTFGRWLGIAGVASIVAQGTLFDHAKNRYLSRTGSSYREGDDLAETLDEIARLERENGPALEAALLKLYTIFLRVQQGLAGQKTSKNKGIEDIEAIDDTAEIDPPPLTGDDAAKLAEIARAWAWLGPSTHVALLATFTAADRVDLYAWLRLVPGNLAAWHLRREFARVERGPSQPARLRVVIGCSVRGSSLLVEPGSARATETAVVCKRRCHDRRTSALEQESGSVVIGACAPPTKAALGCNADRR